MDEKTIARFWSKVDRRAVDGCWPWLAGRRKRWGYGQFKVTRSPGHHESIEAHRVSYEITFGSPVPSLLRHTCDNPPCVNPSHLVPGTYADNAADRDSRGRNRAPKGSAHGISKLTEAQVIDLRQRRAGGETFGTLAERFRISVRNVRRIVSRERWQHVP